MSSIAVDTLKKSGWVARAFQRKTPLAIVLATALAGGGVVWWSLADRQEMAAVCQDLRTACTPAKPGCGMVRVNIGGQYQQICGYLSGANQCNACP
jgi:hypothetical protein